ncbi:MAG: hypothetical protein JWN15_64 [Firmicutes bacterium]|nr:hypothetical protein [Bacillota bacterium]
MLVHYICRVCGMPLATTRAADSFDPRLGLSALTAAERASVLSFQGDSVTVNTYCDTCAAVLTPTNPSGHSH